MLNKRIRAWKWDLKEVLLLTVAHVVQVSEDVLITPVIPTDKYGFSLYRTERIKVVRPDNRILEKDAEFGIPFDADVYILLIPNTQKEEIPIGSQIWTESF